jgi:hypothetical protein
MSNEYFNQLFNPALNKKTSPYTFSGKPKQTIEEFYSDWCKKTKRSGGVLIGASIRELLNDFKNAQIR